MSELRSRIEHFAGPQRASLDFPGATTGWSPGFRPSAPWRDEAWLSIYAKPTGYIAPPVMEITPILKDAA